MAQIARQQMQSREVTVSRLKLIQQLKKNREVHANAYAAAVSGYKAIALASLDKAMVGLGEKIKDRYNKLRHTISELDEKAVPNQREVFTLIQEERVTIPVPKSYVNEYDTAIALFEWEVAEYVKLTYAQFVCFIQDEWDWTSDFIAIHKALTVAN